MKISKENSLIELYKHQVGGHHCIISCNGYIFKPYNEHEAYMYSFIPYKFPQLVPFIPKYYGVTDFTELEVLIDSEAEFLELKTQIEGTSSRHTPHNDSNSDTTTHFLNENGKPNIEKTLWLQKLFYKHFNIKNTCNFMNEQ